MPSRNINRINAPDSYYHIYARGGNKQTIFRDDADYKYFLKLFDRYLATEPTANKTNGLYPTYVDQVELLAYCIMSNHFHLLIYQVSVPFLEKFMKSIMTSYSMYFNLRYKRSGHVFESRYKAVRIDQESYLQHITRYIHLNPRRWESYKYSSLRYYRDGNAPYWLTTGRILEQFNSIQKYMDFVSDYDGMRNSLGEITNQLANK